MTVNRKPTGTASTIPTGLISGVFIALIITIIGATITAKLLDNEIISWQSIGYAVLIIILLASWLGSKTACRKIKRRYIMVSLATGVLYFLLLLIMTALFFGGQYSGVGETAILVLCGSILEMLSANKLKRKKIKHKVRVFNC